MWSRRQVAAEQLVFQIVAGDGVFFRSPGAQVDQFAAFAAEGAVGAFRFPFDGRAAGRALNGGGHDWPPRRVR